MLLSILEKFEILIPMPGKKPDPVNRYLIPYLVNNEKPKEIGDLIKDEKILVRRRYSFGKNRLVVTHCRIPSFWILFETCSEINELYGTCSLLEKRNSINQQR